MQSLKFIAPSWSAPKHINAISTTRLDGFSAGAYQGLNLGKHVKDDANLVSQNRDLLCQQFQLNDLNCWLNQTHSTTLLKLPTSQQTIDHPADASWTTDENQPCIVMTADCLPILVTDKIGSFVCSIHAGWRGLCDGIIEKSIKSICNKQNIKSTDLLVWLGPCIGKEAFEVGDDVRNEFIEHDPKASNAFKPYQDRWLADLHELAKQRLSPLNIAEVTSSELCTFSNPELFYSYRRDGQTGRMATLIWMAEK